MKFLPLIALLATVPAMAASSFYCPGNHGYINIGMNTDQIITACGQPTDIQQSKQALMQKVPVTELIYTNLNKGAVYSGLNSTYQMWSIPSGTTQVNLQVNIINDQVSSVQVNGQSGDAMSVCGGNPIQVGDSADSVYSACGSPTMVNQTYIKRSVQSNVKPVVWMYQSSPYQPSFRLTFLNGVLQSIDQ
jgi:hypothetical protein